MTATTVWTVLSILSTLGALAGVEHTLRTRREARGMLAWILALLLLPGVGLALYLLMGNVPVQRKVRRRARRRQAIRVALAQRARLLANHDALDVPELDAAQRSLIRLASRVGETVVTRGNDVTIYQDAEATFLALSLAIEEAQQHVHLEYYIFAPDDTGRAFRDLLIRKAREGVEVRLLIDAVGSWWIGRSFLAPMREAGVKVAWFLPWGLSSRRLSLNFRNHRKLVVVDGRVGFTGSQNIGDEYLGRKKKYGPWRDTHLRLIGPSVAQLQEVFAEDWHFAAGEDISASKYFPEPKAVGRIAAQIIPSGPDRRPHGLYQLLFGAVGDALNDVCLLTPYFVPDHAMVLTLQTASLRGVRVRLMIPSKSNHRIVLWAGRSCYEDLLEAGVEVYEYEYALLHSKVVIIDGRWAMVGSANMDERSFRINFELTTMLYDSEPTRELQADFDKLLVHCRRITRADLAAWTYGERLTAGLARLATPML